MSDPPCDHLSRIMVCVGLDDKAVPVGEQCSECEEVLPIGWGHDTLVAGLNAVLTCAACGLPSTRLFLLSTGATCGTCVEARKAWRGV